MTSTRRASPGHQSPQRKQGNAGCLTIPVAVSSRWRFGLAWEPAFIQARSASKGMRLAGWPLRRRRSATTDIQRHARLGRPARDRVGHDNLQPA